MAHRCEPKVGLRVHKGNSEADTHVGRSATHTPRRSRSESGLPRKQDEILCEIRISDHVSDCDAVGPCFRLVLRAHQLLGNFGPICSERPRRLATPVGSQPPGRPLHAITGVGHSHVGGAYQLPKSQSGTRKARTRTRSGAHLAHVFLDTPGRLAHLNCQS